MLHVLDGSALHELRLVFGGLLQAARVHVAMEHRLVCARHHRGMVIAQPMSKAHGSQRDFADCADLALCSFSPKLHRGAGRRRWRCAGGSSSLRFGLPSTAKLTALQWDPPFVPSCQRRAAVRSEHTHAQNTKSANVCRVATLVVFSCFRLVCKIQEKNKPGQDLKIVLEVHEGEVEGRYSIEGRAQIQGFSFVVRKFCLLTRSGGCINSAVKCFAIKAPYLGVQEPSITDLQPDSGPAFGGTTVTLTGRYLNSGFQRDVLFGDKRCSILRWLPHNCIYSSFISHSVWIRDKAFNLKKNACSSVSGGTEPSSSIVCRTEVTEDVGSVPVRVLIDSFPVTTTKMFYYKINPVITSVLPQCSVQRLVAPQIWFQTRSIKLVFHFLWVKLLFFTYFLTQGLQAGDTGAESGFCSWNRSRVRFEKHNPASASASKAKSAHPWIYSHVIVLIYSVIPRARLPQVCNGSANATHMECWAPAFPEEMPDEKETGQIFVHMEDQRKVWNSSFEYHANFKVFPFGNEDKILLLRPGENKVSLHVC